MDLAPYVNADFKIMESDAHKMRNSEPFVLTNLIIDEGLDSIIQRIQRYALLDENAIDPQLYR